MSESPSPSWFLGVDLAWADRNRTGLAAVDAEGTLTDLVEVRTDDDIVDWLSGYTAGECLISMDAPVIVHNTSGSRPCEAELGAVFARYDAGAHPSNTSRPEFADGGRAIRLAKRLNLDVDPASGSRQRAIEVYPHPATVALFGLPRTVKYKHKPGRDLDFLRSESLRLMNLIESLETADVPLRVRSHPGWTRIRDSVASAARKVDLKKVEDIIDAVLCAYIGLFSVRRPELTQTFGDVQSGYIITPITPTIRSAAAEPRAATR